jgi:glycosyltransferase involved in cell wall biosynthesis
MSNLLESRGLSIRRITIKWVEHGAKWTLVRRVWSFVSAGWKTAWSKSAIVHTFTGSVSNGFIITLVTVAGKLSGKKVLLSIAGGDYLQFSQHGSRLKRTLLKGLLLIPDILVPCNADMQKALINLGVKQDKIILISNALPDEVGDRANVPAAADFLEFRKCHNPVVLYMGGMQRHYGLLDLISAVSQLKPEFPGLGVAAFVKRGGDLAFEEEVQSQLKANSLWGEFRIFTSVPWVVSAMKESDLMVRSTNEFEGDSRAIREAMAVGLPVVATDMGLRPNGVTLYKAGDVAGLVAALREVVARPGERIPYTDPEGEQNIQRHKALYEKLCRRQ